jgi:bifunctional DNA-binding transcriptional regulator/antitoxin component of YhaV-PrlF toxin-antitoxin module
MTTLTVTARGRVTFGKEVLQHLGVKPGDKMELELLPGGRGVLKAARLGQTMDGFVGLLAGRTEKVATMDEMNGAAAQAWAGRP